MKTKQVTIKGWITYDPCRAKYPESFPDGPFTFRTYKPTDDEVSVQEHSFTVEVPADFDPRPQMVKVLEAKKEQARAEFSALVVEIDRQINQLLAIEG